MRLSKASMTSLLLIITSTYGLQARPGDRLDRSRFHRTFDEEFNGPLSWCSDNCDGQIWRTKYFFSGEMPLSRGVGALHGDTEIAIDPLYLGLGLSPFLIAHGILIIQVRPAEQRTKAAVQNAWPSYYRGPHTAPGFTSGLLTTEYSFRQRYGYFEARIKVPTLSGGWPAFWLFGKAGSYDEIDVSEILTSNPTVQHLGHQWGDQSQPRKTQRADLNASDLSKDFHVYGVLWTKRSIIYYRDDREIAHFRNKGLNDPMYMLLDIATDGDWNRKLGYSTPANASGDMLIDYVRAYQTYPNK
jgi:hypothetical protein